MLLYQVPLQHRRQQLKIQRLLVKPLRHLYNLHLDQYNQRQGKLHLVHLNLPHLHLPHLHLPHLHLSHLHLVHLHLVHLHQANLHLVKGLKEDYNNLPHIL